MSTDETKKNNFHNLLATMTDSNTKNSSSDWNAHPGVVLKRGYQEKEAPLQAGRGPRTHKTLPKNPLSSTKDQGRSND